MTRNLSDKTSWIVAFPQKTLFIENNKGVINAKARIGSVDTI
jgi:hypothetical protein